MSCQDDAPAGVMRYQEAVAWSPEVIAALDAPGRLRCDCDALPLKEFAQTSRRRMGRRGKKPVKCLVLLPLHMYFFLRNTLKMHSGSWLLSVFFESIFLHKISQTKTCVVCDHEKLIFLKLNHVQKSCAPTVPCSVFFWGADAWRSCLNCTNCQPLPCALCGARCFNKICSEPSFGWLNLGWTLAKTSRSPIYCGHALSLSSTFPPKLALLQVVLESALQSKLDKHLVR